MGTIMLVFLQRGERGHSVVVGGLGKGRCFSRGDERNQKVRHLITVGDWIKT